MTNGMQNLICIGICILVFGIQTLVDVFHPASSAMAKGTGDLIIGACLTLIKMGEKQP